MLYNGLLRRGHQHAVPSAAAAAGCTSLIWLARVAKARMVEGLARWGDSAVADFPLLEVSAQRLLY